MRFQIDVQGQASLKKMMVDEAGAGSRRWLVLAGGWWGPSQPSNKVKKGARFFIFKNSRNSEIARAQDFCVKTNKSQ
jgi:hypothetical protein